VPRSCQPLRTASSSSTLDATWRHLLCGAGRQPVLLADTCQLCIPPVILGEHQRLPHHSKPLGEAQCCLPYARADSQQAGAWLQSRKACVQARKPPTDYSTGCACHIPTVLYPQTQPAYGPPPPPFLSPPGLGTPPVESNTSNHCGGNCSWGARQWQASPGVGGPQGRGSKARQQACLALIVWRTCRDKQGSSGWLSVDGHPLSCCTCISLWSTKHTHRHPNGALVPLTKNMPPRPPYTSAHVCQRTVCQCLSIRMLGCLWVVGACVLTKQPPASPPSSSLTSHTHPPLTPRTS
jgi:hypothetical protein